VEVEEVLAVADEVMPVTSDEPTEALPANELPPVASPVEPPRGRKYTVRVVTEPPSKELLWYTAKCVDGLNVQRGVVVLHHQFLAFIPSDKAKNLLGMMAGGLAEAASPIKTVSLDWLKRRPDPLQMVADLWAERKDGGDFFKSLMEIAQGLGGFLWFPDKTRFARPGGTSVMFVNGPTELRGNPPAGAVFDQIIQGWQEVDSPIMGDVIGLVIVSVLPLLLAAALFVGHLLSSDIPWWACLIGLGLAGLMYLLAVLKAVLGWMRRRRKRAATMPPPDSSKTDFEEQLADSLKQR
jgi:hypothetical protein